MPSREELKLLQALPLELKVEKTKARIRDFVNYYGTDGVCVSFSGGKDSTVLLHLVRECYPNVKAVFSDTGLEYPEIRNFVKTIENVDWVKPELTFREIVLKHGYPVFGKEISETIWYARKIVGGVLSKAETARTPKSTDFSRRELQKRGDKSIFNKEKYLPACRDLPFVISGACCRIMKKSPMAKYQHKTGKFPFIGTTTEESRLREKGWLRTGCNSFDTKKPMSKPLSFWLEQDILRYIKENNIPIASVYGEITNDTIDGQMQMENCGKLRCSGCQRTGCMYCAFGAGNEHKKNGKSRYELLAETHPKVYDYVLRGGKWADNPYYDETAPAVEPDGWVNWNPKKIWIPSETGLGMKFVFDEINKIYGKDFIKY